MSIVDSFDGARPDDIREAGWMVAAHNDYRLHGEVWTFWLFTRDGRAVKGEGHTDVLALNDIRAQLGMSQQASR